MLGEPTALDDGGGASRGGVAPFDDGDGGSQHNVISRVIKTIGEHLVIGGIPQFYLGVLDNKKAAGTAA